MAPGALSEAQPRLRSPDEYRESLRDGRRVFYRGEAVLDVTTHDVFRRAVEHASLDYRMAHDERYRELAIGSDGYSRYFTVPLTSEDLLARSALIEAATRAGKTLVVLIKEIGTDAMFSLLALKGEARRAVRRPDPGVLRALPRRGPRSLRRPDRRQGRPRARAPRSRPNPDAYLRIVERRADGIVVRGAKVHTSVSVNANEMIVLPTRAMGPDDSAYAVAFAVPLDTPGLTLVASPYLAHEGEGRVRAPALGEREDGRDDDAVRRRLRAGGTRLHGRTARARRASLRAASSSSTASRRSPTSSRSSTRSSARHCWPRG